MPVVDAIAAEYAGDVEFVAVAWKGSPEATAQRADELLTSGHVRWGLDETEEIFAAYGVPYQPVTVLIDGDRRLIGGWPGAAEADAIRDAIDEYLLGA